MSRFKIIPARSLRDAFFVYGDAPRAMRIATEARDACAMTMVVVEHPEGGLIRHAGTVEHVDPEVRVRKVKRSP